MGSVVTRRRGDRTYVYYVYYDSDGRRTETYCGTETDPESKIRLLRTEMTEIEIQIAGLNAKLAKLKVQIDESGHGAPTRATTDTSHVR